MSEPTTVTEHHITYAEAVALAWMLDLVARRSRAMGCPEAASGFELCATTFRQAVSNSLDSVVEMTHTTIRNLVATATTVGDRLAAEPDHAAGRSAAWALIADELFYRDDTGAALSAYFSDCPTPEMLPRFVQATVAGFKMGSATEISELFE
jgi:hypothetical protein